MKKIYLLLLMAGSVFLAGAQSSHPAAGSDPLSSAMEKYRASAAKGNAGAMAALGRSFDKNGSDICNGDSAVLWWSRAASKGYKGAWYQLGKIYQKGRKDLPQDFAVSAAFFYKGMKAGDINATDRVAYYLYKGLDGRQDYDSAFILFRKLAVSTRQSNAMYFLGLCYRNGYGTSRSADSALYWLSAAASAHEGQARVELASKTPDNPVKPLQLPDRVSALATGSIVVRTAGARSLAGSYAGYLVRYDWSRQHIISILPLQADLQKNGEVVSGSWKEGDQALAIEAVGAGGDLSFKNTSYLKKWHYTLHAPEPWQFVNAGLQLLQSEDSVYLAGDLHLYSPQREEPSPPVYVHLVRVATPADKAATMEAPVVVSPNPFHDRIQVQFSLAGSQRVVVSLVSMQGQVLTREDVGEYGPGSYTQWINVPAAMASGAYIVKVNTGNADGRAVVIKQ